MHREGVQKLKRGARNQNGGTVLEPWKSSKKHSAVSCPFADL